MKFVLPFLCFFIPGSVLAADQQEPIQLLLKASNDILLTSEMNGRMSNVKVRAGDVFKKNQLLFQFDCRKQRANLSRNNAELRGVKKILESRKRLHKLNAGSLLDLNLAEVNVNKAQADVKVSSLEASYCAKLAPFDGKVVLQHLNTNEYAKAGDPVLQIISSGSLVVELLVKVNRLKQFPVGGKVPFEVPFLKKQFVAKIDRIGADVNPVSQLVKVYGHVSSPAVELLPGMIARTSSVESNE